MDSPDAAFKPRKRAAVLRPTFLHAFGSKNT